MPGISGNRVPFSVGVLLESSLAIVDSYCLVRILPLSFPSEFLSMVVYRYVVSLRRGLTKYQTFSPWVGICLIW